MRLLQAYTEQQGNIFCSGILEIMPDGYGFLRQETLLPSPTDVYISPVADKAFRPAQRRYGHRPGPPAQERRKILQPAAGGGHQRHQPGDGRAGRTFGSLTPTFPDKLINLETTAARPVHPSDQPGRAHRPRPARPDRLAAQGRQDACCSRPSPTAHNHQLQRYPPHGLPYRRAPGRGHRYEALRQGRGHRRHLR